MNTFVRDNIAHGNATVVSARCPACGQNGSFRGFPNCPDVTWMVRIPHPQKEGQFANGTSQAGMRQCPNPDCQALLFVVKDPTHGLITYPPEVLDFDATSLPPKINSSLAEAVSCHAAGCHRAAALMVRRVLEEVCDDKSATGKDLKARIAALSGVAVVPPDLLAAADELRILGNDAAHVHAKDYDNISAIESELAIELAKELLKAVYQYADLVARLKALKIS